VVSGQRVLRIATRGSQLALWQANAVRDGLAGSHPDLHIELEVVRTTGDRILDVPLARIGDRGLFTKEIDSALLDGRADIAVHSLKDLPTVIPDGLVLAAIGTREDPADVLITRQGGPGSLVDLPPAARVGTSSLRRRAQLRAIRPDLEVVDLRGNLNTRLAKLDSGEYEAIVLAAAGVRRLGWEERITQVLSVEDWLPAVGQGALAMVCRADDTETIELLGALHDPATAACVLAERSFLRYLEGGCQVPIGALATLSASRLTLDGFVSDLEGASLLRERRSGPASEPDSIGEDLARALVDRGAGRILQSIRGEAAPPGIAPP
jgi:hydroxymethylbilane synthase